jgi:hypothetical protein
VIGATLKGSLLTKAAATHVDYTGKQKYLRHIEDERLSIDFEEDPIAYFMKRKDGRGHQFIWWLTHSLT